MSILTHDPIPDSIHFLHSHGTQGGKKAIMISQIWYQVSESVFKFVFMHNLRLLFDLPKLPKWDPHLVHTHCEEIKNDKSNPKTEIKDTLAEDS